jgi:uncharacterized membrane protein
MKSALKIFFKGLVVVIPLGVTMYVIFWLGSSAEALLAPPLRRLLPADGLLRYRQGTGVLIGLAAVFVVGLLTYTFVFRKVLDWIELLLNKVPLVKSLYGGLRDLMDLLSRTQEMAKANEVVAVEFGKDLRLLGFITQPETEGIPAPLTDEEDRVAVYLPMSYQLGGYTLFVDRSRLHPIDMSIEDGMRYALTAAMSSREGESSQSPENETPGAAEQGRAERRKSTADDRREP